MDEAQGRLELVKGEITELQQAIRAYDTSIFQARSWGVTVGTATAGLVLTGRNLAGLLGILASIGFALLESHLRVTQSALIMRARQIECTLNSADLESALTVDPQTPGAFRVPWLANHLAEQPSGLRSRSVANFRFLAHSSTAWIYFGVAVVQVAAMVANSRGW